MKDKTLSMHVNQNSLTQTRLNAIRQAILRTTGLKFCSDIKSNDKWRGDVEKMFYLFFVLMSIFITSEIKTDSCSR